MNDEVKNIRIDNSINNSLDRNELDECFKNNKKNEGNKTSFN